MDKSTNSHRKKSPIKVTISIITCSSSRYKDKAKGKLIEDPSGDLIEKFLINNGHIVFNRSLISDDKLMIKNAIKDAISNDKIDSIIITGGTGIAPQDVTIESVKDVLDKEIPGFGELFRNISYEEVGPAAIITRALAGVIQEKPIFCVPGSPNAVKKAMENLIIPEICHIVKHAKGL